MPHVRSWVGRLTGIAAALACSTVALGQPVERQVRDLFSRIKLGGASVSVCVVDATTGEVLAGIDENRPMLPASNLKVLTSGAALLALGKDFDFRTRLVIDGTRLIVVGAGDPGLADPELLGEMKLSVGAFADRLIDSIRPAVPAGVRLTEVILDDRVFDRDAVHPSWPADQLNRWYCAEVSGLNFHANVLQVFATGSPKPGQPASLRTEPSAPWIELINSVQTVGTGSSAIALYRDGATGFRFRVTGTVRPIAMDPVEVTVHDPALLLGRLLADRLAAAGLAGPSLNVRLAADDDRFDLSRVAAVVRTPLATALKRCNSDSHNLYAESLLKRLGHEVTGQPGSWANGAAVVRMQVSERLGGDLGALVMADGSGLSRENRVTARLLATWMASVGRAEQGTGDLYIESMATPGEGSWSNRFRDLAKLQSQFKGKSGFINDVLCLSGFLIHPNGRRLTFSVLANGTNQAPPGKVREFQEAVVEQLDRWMARAGPGRPAVGG